MRACVGTIMDQPSLSRMMTCPLSGLSVTSESSVVRETVNRSSSSRMSSSVTGILEHWRLVDEPKVRVTEREV